MSDILDGRSLAEVLAAIPEDDRAKVLEGLTEEQSAALQYDWRFWGRKNQQQPEGDWNYWLLLAGRGFGKTRVGAETVRQWVCGDTPLAGGKYGRIALVAETAADARDVLVEGESGLLAVHPKDFRPLYEPSKRRLTWPNGATASLYNATEPDQLRGPQSDAAWCDETTKWQYLRETWDMLQFGNRLGSHPRVIITTTPRPLPVLKEIMRLPGCIVTRGSTKENASNLAPSFLRTIVDRYAGTRLGRQELDAEILDDVPGALWSRDRIEDLRVRAGEVPQLIRVVVGVDPAVTSGENSDETGIVVAGIARSPDGYMIGYVIGDYSIRGTPDEWARAVVAAYRLHRADKIVAEVNQGGELVAAMIRSVDPNVSVTTVHAKRGKFTRAEPIAALYEQKRFRHVGAFPALEDQMVSFTPEGKTEAGSSPDRVDAFVYAATDLFSAITAKGQGRDKPLPTKAVRRSPFRWKS